MKNILSLFFIFLNFASSAQLVNLVSNGSFEDGHQVSSIKPYEDDFATGWKASSYWTAWIFSQELSDPHFYSVTVTWPESGQLTGTIGTPDNFLGSQTPHSGRAYAGI